MSMRTGCNVQLCRDTDNYEERKRRNIDKIKQHRSKSWFRLQFVLWAMGMGRDITVDIENQKKSREEKEKRNKTTRD